MIWNVNNKLITNKTLSDILKTCGIKTRIKKENKDKFYNLLRSAFVHKSYSIINENAVADIEYPKGVIPLQEKNNETLEWLGDGVIQLISTAYLYERYPSQNEGFLTETRSKLVKTKSLSLLANFLNFGEFILMSTHVEENSGGRTNSKILEDAFEAFVGALFLFFKEEKNEEKAYTICKTFFITLIEKVVDITSLIKNDVNYKNKLMKEFQRHFSMYPKYDLFNEEKDDNNRRVYHICVKTPDGKIIGKGFGRSKKRAEQFSAKMAFEYLEKKPVS